jgi:hypothetical protein
MTNTITSIYDDSESGATRLMTPHEVADKLRVGLRTLARWRSIRFGPSYCKLGRGIRYHRRDVNDWISSRGRHSISSELSVGNAPVSDGQER